MIKKKIIFISHGLRVGGAEKFLISIANAVRNHFSVNILAISEGKDLIHELSEKVKFIRCPKMG